MVVASAEVVVAVVTSKGFKQSKDNRKQGKMKKYAWNGNVSDMTKLKNIQTVLEFN